MSRWSSVKYFHQVGALHEILNATIAIAAVDRETAYDALSLTMADFLGRINDAAQARRRKLEPITKEILRAFPELVAGGSTYGPESFAIDPVCDQLKLMLYEERGKSIRRHKLLEWEQIDASQTRSQ